jgi:hypothetical protein
LADVNLAADEVIRKARAKGVNAPENSIRGLVYNIRSEIRKGMAKSAPAATRPVPASQSAPKPTSPASKPSASGKLTKPAPKASSSAKLPTPSSSPTGVTQVLANVARVNQVVGTCGGVDHARETAEAVRACGGVEAFLKHLDLVAEIQAKPSA